MVLPFVSQFFSADSVLLLLRPCSKTNRGRAEPPHLIGSHGRIVFHPLFNDFDHGTEDFGVGRLLDQRREDDLDEVLPHLHTHDGQSGLHQVEAQHYELTGHCEGKRFGRQKEDWDRRRHDKTVSENLDEKFRHKQPLVAQL